MVTRIQSACANESAATIKDIKDQTAESGENREDHGKVCGSGEGGLRGVCTGRTACRSAPVLLARFPCPQGAYNTYTCHLSCRLMCVL